MAVGPVLPLGLFGILALLVWNKKESWNTLKYFVAWIVAWLGFLFIFNQIPQQSPTRFTQMVPHIPLGVVAAFSLYQISQLSFIKKRYGFVLYSLLLIPVALGMGSMASSYMWQKDFVDHKLRATLPIVPSGAQVMYPMKEIIDGMTWLQVYTPRDAVVLSAMTTGNYIPVYAGNTAYVGHANTVDLENKLMQVEFFYTRYNQKIAPEVGFNWLKEQNISYVFYGFEEQAFNEGKISDLRTLYPMLEQTYESANVKIYKVNKKTTFSVVRDR
jgi:hypothetical protein